VARYLGVQAVGKPPSVKVEAKFAAESALK